MQTSAFKNKIIFIIIFIIFIITIIILRLLIIIHLFIIVSGLHMKSLMWWLIIKILLFWLGEKWRISHHEISLQKHIQNKNKQKTKCMCGLHITSKNLDENTNLLELAENSDQIRLHTMTVTQCLVFFQLTGKIIRKITKCTKTKVSFNINQLKIN